VAGTGGVAGDGRPGVPRAVPDGWSGDETPKREKGGVPTLKHSQGGEGTGWVLGNGSLRKLSTLEYERLQGFPDGYTEVEYPPGSGKVATKRAREGALGNAFSPVILYWLGRRVEYLYRLGHRGIGCCRE
jgi:DNA (cytosine-5)-methyltransferase 1